MIKKEEDIDREVNKNLDGIMFRVPQEINLKAESQTFFLRLLLYVCNSFYLKSLFNTPKKTKHTCNLIQYWYSENILIMIYEMVR